jgi:hypothetical protein
LLVLVWFRKHEDLTLLGAGFGISRATAYRYRDERIAVLAAQAQDLHTALKRAAADGWSYVILDGKLFDCDRLTENTLSSKGETIDAWYSGTHRDFGASIQVIMHRTGYRLDLRGNARTPARTSCAHDLGALARRTRLRRPRRPLESPTSHHDQPTPDRRHRRRRAPPDGISNTST